MYTFRLERIVGNGADIAYEILSKPQNCDDIDMFFAKISSSEQIKILELQCGYIESLRGKIISVNVSSSVFFDANFCHVLNKMKRIAQKNNLLICLELHEVGIENLVGEKTIEYINKLKDDGFYIWMDDYGSGGATIDVLGVIPFDCVKIDKEYFWSLFNEARNELDDKIEILKHKYNVNIVIEGIESIEHYNYAKEKVCLSQGYYFN